MTDQLFHGIEMLPEAIPARQLFVLLHGLGANASSLVPLAHQIRAAFPHAAILLPEAFFPFDGGGNGRQWYSNRDVTDKVRPLRVAEVMPQLHSLMLQAQQRYGVRAEATVLAGFSQGAIMALEFSSVHDGGVGRVIAFSGRYARLPDSAPALTTLHILHGEDDQVIPVKHAYAAEERLQQIEGDFTLDIVPAIGHEIHDELAGCAIHRLQNTIPKRTWLQAMKGA